MSVCVTISLMTCAVKKPCGSGDKDVVDFNMAADSFSAWKDEEVGALIDIFSEETIQFSTAPLPLPNGSFNRAVRE